MKKNLIFALGLSLITGFTACSSEIEDGTTDIDSWEMPYEEVVAKYTYTHPCAMFNEADFTRVKTMLDNGSAPQAVKDEFNLLKSSQFTNVTYTPSPTEKIVRGDATGTGTNENYSNAMRDAAAAYQMCIRDSFSLKKMRRLTSCPCLKSSIRIFSKRTLRIRLLSPALMARQP